MLIKMLQTRYGCEGNYGVQRFIKGRFYEMACSLAQSFVRDKQAEKVELIDGCTNPAWYNLFPEVAEAAKVDKELREAARRDADFPSMDKKAVRFRKRFNEVMAA